MQLGRTGVLKTDAVFKGAYERLISIKSCCKKMTLSLVIMPTYIHRSGPCAYSKKFTSFTASCSRACDDPPYTKLETVRQKTGLPSRMGWIPVKFDNVRYSPIERTHYFWDPEYPQWIQFLRDDKWSSWHIGYVREYAFCNMPL
jgi:hypothetical protein